LKIALGHLGGLTPAIKTSLEDLGVETALPPPNTKLLLETGKEKISSGLCFPLKIALGNYLEVQKLEPDAVLFYSGCDLCNLPPANLLFKEILNNQGYFPETYFCSIHSKKHFIYSYFNVLTNITDKPADRVLMSMYLCGIKYNTFSFLDKVFYAIRPIFDDSTHCEKLYKEFWDKISLATTVSSVEKLSFELWELYRYYTSMKSPSFHRIGLIGDSYSLMEPSSHNYTDKTIGNLKVIVDKWSQNYLLPSENANYLRTFCKINNLLCKKSGVFTSLEIKKIAKYTAEKYDGLIFISPMNCNPNETLRNALNKITSEFNIPVLDLVVDEHDSNTGQNTRIEAFIDMIKRKNPSKTYKLTPTIKYQKFSLLKFLHAPLY